MTLYSTFGVPDDRLRTRELEEHALEGREACGIEVLDHLDDDRRVESREALVPVRERAVKEADAPALLLGHPLESQAVRRDLERAVRDVDADDLLEGRLGKERTEDASAAAAEVEDALGAFLREAV